MTTSRLFLLTVASILAFHSGVNATADEPTGVAALMPLLKQLDDPEFQFDILKGMAAGLEGNRRIAMPPGWEEVAKKLAKSTKPEVRDLSQRLSILFGDQATIRAFRKIVADAKSETKDRESALATLLSIKDAELPPLLHELLVQPALARAALKGLASYDDPKTADLILAAYPRFEDAAKPDALATLATRVSYARQLMTAIKDHKIPRTDLSAVTIQQLKGLGSAEIDAQIEAVWGIVRGTSVERKQEIDKYRGLLKTPPAAAIDLPHGRALFVKTCQQCHTLYGEGGKVGPDITGANRADLEYLLLNIVDPSAILAKDYQMSIVHTTDGRSLSGIVSKQDDATLTLVMPTETLTLPKKEIEAIKLSEISLMPEGILSKLSEQELRDLIAYLQNRAQVPLPK